MPMMQALSLPVSSGCDFQPHLPRQAVPGDRFSRLAPIPDAHRRRSKCVGLPHFNSHGIQKKQGQANSARLSYKLP